VYVKPSFDWDGRNSRIVSVEGRRSDTIIFPGVEDYIGALVQQITPDDGESHKKHSIPITGG
jgi:hypothetical protein